MSKLAALLLCAAPFVGLALAGVTGQTGLKSPAPAATPVCPGPASAVWVDYYVVVDAFYWQGGSCVLSKP